MSKNSQAYEDVYFLREIQQTDEKLFDDRPQASKRDKQTLKTQKN
jgi:hypothetical protein